MTNFFFLHAWDAATAHPTHGVVADIREYSLYKSHFTKFDWEEIID